MRRRLAAEHGLRRTAARRRRRRRRRRRKGRRGRGPCGRPGVCPGGERGRGRGVAGLGAGRPGAHAAHAAPGQSERCLVPRRRHRAVVPQARAREARTSAALAAKAAAQASVQAAAACAVASAAARVARELRWGWSLARGDGCRRRRRGRDAGRGGDDHGGRGGAAAVQVDARAGAARVSRRRGGRRCRRGRGPRRGRKGALRRRAQPRRRQRIIRAGLACGAIRDHDARRGRGPWGRAAAGKRRLRADRRRSRRSSPEGGRRSLQLLRLPSEVELGKHGVDGHHPLVPRALVVGEHRDFFLLRVARDNDVEAALAAVLLVLQPHHRRQPAQLKHDKRLTPARVRLIAEALHLGEAAGTVRRAKPWVKQHYTKRRARAT